RGAALCSSTTSYATCCTRTATSPSRCCARSRRRSARPPLSRRVSLTPPERSHPVARSGLYDARAACTPRRYRDRMSDRVAIYPGSFDPPTNGHLDIVEPSPRLVDHFVVRVAHNAHRRTVFSAEERIQLMREACAQPKN